MEAETPEEKQQVFTKLTSTPSAASDQPPQRVGAVKELTLIKQDIVMSMPDLPTWLVTVPCKLVSLINMPCLTATFSFKNIFLSHGIEKERFRGLHTFYPSRPSVCQGREHLCYQGHLAFLPHQLLFQCGLSPSRRSVLHRT